MNEQLKNCAWLEEFQILAQRFGSLGIQADMAALSLHELGGLYCYLQNLAGQS